VTVIVPFRRRRQHRHDGAAGAQHLTCKLCQTFVIENKPSAGWLARGQATGARPACAGGYTLLFSASANINLTPQVQKLNFDPTKQLVPITNMGTGTQIMAIKRSLPVTTLPEFIAYAKANPGKLNFTVAGTQNISHLAPVLLFARAGIDLVMIPAEGRPSGGLRPSRRPGRCLFRQRLGSCCRISTATRSGCWSRAPRSGLGLRPTSRRSPRRCRVSNSRRGTASRLRPERLSPS
jgi:hypothetical protein